MENIDTVAENPQYFEMLTSANLKHLDFIIEN
jgi:hypothetical protein